MSTDSQYGGRDLVKTVDLGPFLDGRNKQYVADALLESLRTTGFVYLTNHGLDEGKIEKMFELTKRFFALSHEHKMLAPHPPSGTHHRGYSAPGAEKVTQHLYDLTDISEARKRVDVKETFEVGRENDEFMPNIWLPEEILPGFQQRCLQFFWDCFEIEKGILRILAVGFNLPEDYFLKFHTKPDNQLRLLHYPSIPSKALLNGELSRIEAHSDFGSLTLLMQDAIGGLEVQDPISRNFRPVHPIPGAILLNAGDFLMRWSNDTIKSTIHRVRAPQGIIGDIVPDRYSIPYFCCADFETTVECIPNTWGPNNPQKYEPISAKEYIMRRLAANY